MLTYIQIHYYLLWPLLAVLLAVYHPLLGRRDGLKIVFLCFMATLYTTPWDNWILSQGGWGYPPGSLIGQIYLVPVEEHLFFLIHSIFLVILHALFTHSTLIPFALPPILRQAQSVVSGSPRLVQTLPRRPLAAIFWVGIMTLGALMVNEAHYVYPALTPESLRFGRHWFYMGWILIWVSPVVGWLSYLGARLRQNEWKAWAVGSLWLCMVDTIALRNGAWSISRETSLGIEVVRGLPLEEFTFFLIVSYLVSIACSLISHLHTLLILSPDLPPCPPSNPITHIALLACVAFERPAIDANILEALHTAEETLRKGSKSFDVAKLAFGREIRIGLIAMYAWCRVTDNLVDEPAVNSREARLETIRQIRAHLSAVYQKTPPIPGHSELDALLDEIPQISENDRSAFHLFAAIIPRFVPPKPFFELCDGYETDIAFVTPVAGARTSPLETLIMRPDFDLEQHLPIRTSADLLRYADDVAGSIAAAICHLSWSILVGSSDPVSDVSPVDTLDLSHMERTKIEPKKAHIDSAIRTETVEKARQMGRALQLVNISRDIAKDSLIGRLYIPVSAFASWKDLQEVLLPGSQAPSYAPYTKTYLELAEQMRQSSIGATANLPRTARGGARAMAASYFEIATAIRRHHGEVDERGIKVDKWRRILAASKAFWGLST